tara:strand:+ start:50 stop:952 length:903 start_codon:yes stop_codon:yes gene_type:complete
MRPAEALGALGALVAELKQGQVSDPEQHLQRSQSADGLFLLGWLYQQGGYGVAKDREKSTALIQQAAEKGQLDAMHYCWRRCLDLTPEVLDQLQRAVARNQGQALYLQSQLASAAVSGRSPDQLLLDAARQGHPDAIGRLYTVHFVDWARQTRTLKEAVAKLERCVSEGVSVCFYLLGALQERHQDHQQALLYYQVLALVDPIMYRTYVDAEHLARLVQYLPQQQAAVTQSRAASYLAQLPISGNPQIDRFKRCGADYPCARRLSQNDNRCMLGYFEASHLLGLRDSPGYRACQALSADF